MTLHEGERLNDCAGDVSLVRYALTSDFVQLTQLNVTFRTEVCVGSSRYRAVAAKNRAVPVTYASGAIRAPAIRKPTLRVFTLDVTETQ